MSAIFLEIFNLSISASYLVLTIVLLRLIFKKIPKAFICIMWGLVALRLIFPFSIESFLSLIPSGETIPQNIIYSEKPQIHSGIYTLNSVINPMISDSLAPNPQNSVNPAQVIAFIMSVVWLVGIAVMLSYAVISYVRISHRVKESITENNKTYICDRIDTPFILGVIKPKIYLPSSISEQDKKYVLEHENAHLKRLDHLWKPLGFLLLTVYWFNPFLWLAYSLLCKDIEIACDQKVIKEMGTEYKKDYSNALINCSVPRKMISACPLAFGEVGVKNRIKSVLNYKKPAFWIIILSVVLSIAVAVCFLTVPKGQKLYEINDGWINITLLDNVKEVGLVQGNAHRDDMITSNFSGIIDELHKVKISRKPISNDRTNNRERENIIILRKGDSHEILCFSKGYSSVFIDNGVKPTLSYKVLNPEKVEAIFRNYPKNTGITGTVTAAECDNVEYSLVYGGKDYIEVKWKNNRKEAVCFGEEFKIYKNGKLHKPDTEMYWDLLLYTVNPGGQTSETYHLSNYTLENGNYTLEKEFYLENDPDLKYRAYIDFTVGDRYIFVGKQYEGEKIVYEGGILSSIIFTDENIPIYGVSENNFHLYSSDWPIVTTHSSMYDIGELKKVDLKKHKFKDLFSDTEWKENYSLKSLINDNKNAFFVGDYGHNKIYYLLEQKNGEVYIAQGHSDLNMIRYVFKMKAVEDIFTDATATFTYTDSPEQISPTLNLNYTEKSFTFSYSGFSSYLPRGKFTVSGKNIICKTDDGNNNYVFEKSDNAYIFDAEKSSEIPKYKYSEDAKTSVCPVPDGAVFKKLIAHEGKNPYFNAKVIGVFENSILVKPLENRDAINKDKEYIVSTDVISTNPVPELTDRTEIRIVYNGNIEETYPEKISGVFAIYLLKDVE